MTRLSLYSTTLLAKLPFKYWKVIIFSENSVSTNLKQKHDKKKLFKNSRDYIDKLL